MIFLFHFTSHNQSLEGFNNTSTVKVYDIDTNNFIELLVCGKIVICQGVLLNKSGSITIFSEQYRPIEDIRFNVHSNEGTLYTNGEFYSSKPLSGFFNFTYLLASTK